MEKGRECLEKPYDHFETKIKSPTSKLGFIDPDGILKGSAKKDLIIKAIKTAKDIDFKLLIKLFLFIKYYYIGNCIIFFIT